MALTSTLFRLRAVLLVLLVAAVLSGAAAVRMTYRHFRIEREVDQVQDEIAALERERMELEHSLSAIEDLATIERLARETLNLQREDEHVVILVPGEEGSATPQDADEEMPAGVPAEPSNLVKWWGYFFGP